MTYRILRKGTLVDKRMDRFRYHTVSRDDLVTEAVAAGLDFEPKDDPLVVLQARSR